MASKLYTHISIYFQILIRVLINPFQTKPKNWLSLPFTIVIDTSVEKGNYGNCVSNLEI